MKTESIERLKNLVLDCGGEVFFGDIILEEGDGYLGNSEMPVVTACICSETVLIRIHAVKVDCNGDFHIIGEYSSGGVGTDENDIGSNWDADEIIDPVDVNDILLDGIDDIADAIIVEEHSIWLRLGVTVKGTKKEIEEILENGAETGETLWNLLENKCFEINGESYIPASCVEEYNKENGTDFEEKDIELVF